MFDNYFTTLSQTAVNSDYRGIFATSGSTVSLSANLSSLSAEGADIVKWVRYRMGEPKIVAEIDNVHHDLVTPVSLVSQRQGTELSSLSCSSSLDSSFEATISPALPYFLKTLRFCFSH